MEMELIVGIGDDHGRKLRLGHGYSAHLLLARPKGVGEVAEPPVRSADEQQGRYGSPEPGRSGAVQGDRRPRDPLDLARGEMTLTSTDGMVLPVRRGPRPKATTTSPHTQLDQIAPVELQDRLRDHALALAGVRPGPSRVS